MRYAVISDIHSNLEAFKAVMDSLSKDRIDKYICVGDVVGYGADPSMCIKLLKSLDAEVLIAGNHDWGVLDLLDLEYFNDYAKAAILWTKNMLGQEEKEWLKKFKIEYEGKEFALVHGTLNEPKEFHYILDENDAIHTFRLMSAPVCFVGHSHVAGIFLSDEGVASSVSEQKVLIDAAKKYVVNVGSVGQPRDGDPRASFAIYDSEKKEVQINRVEYDIKSAQKKILDAALPERLAARLAEGR